MKNHLQNRAARLFPSAAKIRAVAATLILLVLASCASQVSREAEIAGVEAERLAIEQEAVQLAADKARARAAELQLQRDREAAERARVEEARVRQVAEARARADAERERRAVVASAAAEAERQDRLDRITALEQQIASIETEVGEEESRVTTLTRAVEAAEELLTTLAAEQFKYESTDDQGNTVEPLAKELIAELESRKNELVRQANSL
jgi:chromosome segregation ATPase